MATSKAIAELRGVQLVMPDCAPESLCAPGGTLLFGDVRRLQQCINNGLSNAVKFSERGQRVWLEMALEVYTHPPRSHSHPQQQQQQQPPPPPLPRPTPSRGTYGTIAPVPHTSSRQATTTVRLGGGTSNAGSSSDHTVNSVHDGLGSPSACLLIRVRDEGIGLDGAELAKLSTNEIFNQVGKGQLQGARTPRAGQGERFAQGKGPALLPLARPATRDWLGGEGLDELGAIDTRTEKRISIGTCARTRAPRASSHAPPLTCRALHTPPSRLSACRQWRHGPRARHRAPAAAAARRLNSRDQV
jgi:hypothetical protein